MNVCSMKDCENERRPKQHYCRECHAAYMREQRAQGKNKRKHTKNEMFKRKARNAANNAVRDGKLKKAECCEKCGVTGVTLQKHHEDYSKPLEVEWLCTLCHGKVHSHDEDMAETG